MEHLKVNVNVKNKPLLDPEFIPIGKFTDAFLAGARQPFGIAIKRNLEQVAVFNTFVHGEKEMIDADVCYIDRLVKTLLWMKGGYAIYLSGDENICEEIACRYSKNGLHAFDNDFMSKIYDKDFEVLQVKVLPQEKSISQSIGGQTNGCRIGFDAGGSDRKVSAVIDGECVFSEEVLWHPKTNADPEYHYDGIMSAMKSAAKHMPRVDAIGVSSAGVYIDNETKAASLFLKVPSDLFETKVRNIYKRVADDLGNIPVTVCNDGDVTALAGAVSLDDTNVLGIAMGTSEAAGYVDKNGNITGWLNELAFAPVDLNPCAPQDEWSFDFGVGCKYFSQDAVIRLAEKAGIKLDDNLSLAKKLKFVQELTEQGDERAENIFTTIGCYLAHTLVHYHYLYGFKHVLLLGRVMSGKGGDIILDICRQVLADEYPQVATAIKPSLPDEKFRRLGQSAIAATLPSINSPG